MIEGYGKCKIELARGGCRVLRQQGWGGGVHTGWGTELPSCSLSSSVKEHSPWIQSPLLWPHLTLVTSLPKAALPSTCAV